MLPADLFRYGFSSSTFSKIGDFPGCLLNNIMQRSKRNEGKGFVAFNDVKRNFFNPECGISVKIVYLNFRRV